jgi:hypothetical protein
MSRIAKLVAVVANAPLLVAAAVVVDSLRMGEQEHPPCRACAQASDDVPQATVCELSNNHQKYTGKLVRVAAEFEHDSGQLFLRDGNCIIHAGFAKEKQSYTGAWRRLQVMCGVDGWYDSTAPVSVLGAISKIPDGNYYSGEEGFTISCLEQVRIEPDSSQQERFARARLFRGLL